VSHQIRISLTYVLTLACSYEDSNVQAIRQSFEAGHQLGHHTWAHIDLTTLTNDEIDEQIGRLNDAYVRILGVKPKIFRPPYGSITDDIATYLKDKWDL
jgi:peptidoglycan/xylan/chitin deacetylase (PgdA/CDA1 family)